MYEQVHLRVGTRSSFCGEERISLLLFLPLFPPSWEREEHLQSHICLLGELLPCSWVSGDTWWSLRREFSFPESRLAISYELLSRGRPLARCRKFLLDSSLYSLDRGLHLYCSRSYEMKVVSASQGEEREWKLVLAFYNPFEGAWIPGVLFWWRTRCWVVLVLLCLRQERTGREGEEREHRDSHGEKRSERDNDLKSLRQGIDTQIDSREIEGCLQRSAPLCCSIQLDRSSGIITLYILLELHIAR